MAVCYGQQLVGSVSKTVANPVRSKGPASDGQGSRYGEVCSIVYGAALYCELTQAQLKQARAQYEALMLHVVGSGERLRAWKSELSRFIHPPLWRCQVSGARVQYRARTSQPRAVIVPCSPAGQQSLGIDA